MDGSDAWVNVFDVGDTPAVVGADDFYVVGSRFGVAMGSGGYIGAICDGFGFGKVRVSFVSPEDFEIAVAVWVIEVKGEDNFEAIFGNFPNGFENFW